MKCVSYPAPRWRICSRSSRAVESGFVSWDACEVPGGDLTRSHGWRIGPGELNMKYEVYVVMLFCRGGRLRVVTVVCFGGAN